ncbi:MAG: T9SS type A sorting domain-containing protein [Bacteroidota bacterium]
MKIKITILIVSVILFQNASASVINVPAQYATIQAAILASSNGDTVAVSPGTYFENINFRGKSIVLTSLFYLTHDTAYISNTIINGSTPVNPDTASCIILNSFEDSTTVIQGFTITGGAGTKWFDIHGAGTFREGGGILTEFSSATIQFNIIKDNFVNNTVGVSSTGGGAIRCGDGNLLIRNNTICNNQAYGYGGGIVSNYCTATIQNNLIFNNSGGLVYGGGGIWLTGTNTNTQVNVINNTIVNNHVTGTGNYGGKGSAVFVFSIQANLENNIIWGNTQSAGGPLATFFGGLIDANYCDIQVPYAGIGNIFTDPLLADSTYFFLSSISPCIDAGDPDSSFNDLTISANVAAFPSMGNELNDMGVYGGQTVEVLPACVLAATGNNNIPNLLSFNLFPNPADDYLNIDYDVNLIKGAIGYSIIDSKGSEILSGIIKQHSISIKNIPTGIYTLVLKTISGYVFKQFMKK